mmetsp:Transcript_30423/g.41657  ORF Transcript_30423/g.41657 Transcript_30423/m.41657 type:complete len:83 (-) Transcript_30423:488-736(-)
MFSYQPKTPNFPNQSLLNALTMLSLPPEMVFDCSESSLSTDILRRSMSSEYDLVGKRFAIIARTAATLGAACEVPVMRPNLL